MKKALAFMLLVCLLIGIGPTVLGSTSVLAEFYVSQSGNDQNDGSQKAPFLTIERAQEAIREINGNMTGNIIVHLPAGRYELTESLRFRVADSGSNGYQVIYQGAGAEQTVISGAQKINGFKPWRDGIWSAEAPQLTKARDLYVNEKPAQRARTEKKIKAALVPAGTGGTTSNYQDLEDPYFTYDGLYINKADLGAYKNPEDMILHMLVYWMDYQFRVTDIIEDPQSTERWIVKLENPIWDACAKRHANAAAGDKMLVPSASWLFTMENALELLDEPGEFYFDKKLKKLYYYPRPDENMETAEVLVPQLDSLMRVDGRDINHMAHDITFSNIGFAHAANSRSELSGWANQQGESVLFPATPKQTTPGAVEVNWASKINFTSCGIWGTELAGLVFGDGVRDSSVTGSIFRDTGSSAFLLGMAHHDRYEEPADKSRVANVMFQKGWWSSYNYGNGATTTLINGDVGYEYYDIQATWRNEPWAERDGIKSWIICDLEDAYHLENIRLSFAINNSYGTVPVTEQERNNFEVLLSNDKSFSTYVTAKTFTTPADLWQDIPLDFAEGYRYIMLRKTVAEPFAVTGIWAYSHDREPLGKTGLCKNIKFENNYVTRAARVHSQAPALMIHYTDSATIRHNEIIDVGHCSLSIGWGWELINTTAKDNVIENNLFDGNLFDANDGGAIYVLGNQENLTIRNNVAKNQDNMFGTYYFDTGAGAGITMDNNVAINVPFTLQFDGKPESHANLTTPAGNVTNTYSDGAPNNIYGDQSHINTEPVKFFTLDNPPEAVVAIMAGAGLEPEYAHLRETERGETVWLEGPDQCRSYHHPSIYHQDQASERVRAYKETAENLLANASFGTLPWQVDPVSKFEVSNALNAVLTNGNRANDYNYDPGSGLYGHILEQFDLKNALEKANDSVHHLSLDETLQLCKELISGANSANALGGYPATAITAFQTAIDEAERGNLETATEQAIAAHHLEQAAETFVNSRYAADLVFAYIKGGTTETDVENRETVITVPFNTSLYGLDIKTLVSPGAELITNLSDFYQSATLKILHPDSGIEGTWTLRVQKEQPTVLDSVTVGTNGADWKTNNPNVTMTNTGSTLVLQPWWTPYIYQKVASNEINWRLYPSAPDYPYTLSSNGDVAGAFGAELGIELLFGCQSKDLEIDVKEAKNTCYRLRILGNELMLLRMKSGESFEVARTSDFDINYDNYNDIHLADNGNTLTVTINNRTVMTVTLESDAFKGYCGIYTRQARVKLGTSETVSLVNAACGRPAFANAWLTGYEPAKAVDGDVSTFYTNNTTHYGVRFIVDLEQAYPIFAIDYAARNDGESGKNFYIYVSNDPTFDTKKLVHSQGDTLLSSGGERFSLPDSYLNYRYVMVEKAPGLGDLGISELQVLVPEASFTSSTATPANCLSKNRPVETSHSHDNAKNLTSVYTNEFYGAAEAAGDEFYAFIDLGKPMPLDYVAISSHVPTDTDPELLGLHALYRRNFQLIASNDPNFAKENDVILAYEKEPISPDGLRLYPVSGEQDYYRYVGVRALAVGEDLIRLRLNQLDVYTKRTISSESFGSALVEQTSDGIKVSVRGFADQQKEYQFVLAYYDKTGRLVTAQNKPVTVSSPNTYVTITETFNLPNESGTAKFFFWDSFTAMCPVIPVTSLQVKETVEYESVSDNSIAYSREYSDPNAIANNKGDVLRDGLVDPGT